MGVFPAASSGAGGPRERWGKNRPGLPRPSGSGRVADRTVPGRGWPHGDRPRGVGSEMRSRAVLRGSPASGVIIPFAGRRREGHASANRCPDAPGRAGGEVRPEREARPRAVATAPPASQSTPASGVVTPDPLRSAKPQPGSVSGSVNFRTRECPEMRNHAKISFRTRHMRFLPHGVSRGAGSREARVRLILTGGEHEPHAISVRKSHILQGKCADRSIFYATGRSSPRFPTFGSRLAATGGRQPRPMAFPSRLRATSPSRAVSSGERKRSRLCSL